MKSDPLLVFRTKARGLGRRELQAFARELQENVADGREYCCMITGDKELRRLNCEYLDSDYATDVLSFASGSAVGPLGDIAISYERAVEQAAERGYETSTELRVLLLHGLLHLLGHDHESDKGLMRRKETRLRKKYGLPAGLIERTR